MKQAVSLRTRLIAAATAWIAFGMVLSWFILSNVFQAHVTQQFYEELFVHLEELQRLAHVDDGRAVLRAPLSDPRYEVTDSGYYWEIHQGGNVLARSASMKAAPLRTPPDQRTDVGVHTHQIAGPTGALLVAEKLEWKTPDATPVQFLIGTDQRHLDAVVSRFNRTLSWALTTLGLSMVLAAALLILFAMRPLVQVHSALHDIRVGKASKLEGAHPAEVQPLVESMNALLTSTNELVQRARTQAGNIAHGLKTSLAILTDEAYRLSEQGHAKAAETILDQCRRMQTQIDYQTTRARIVANRLSIGAAAEVSAAAHDVLNAISRLHASRGLQVETELSPALWVTCHRQDLQEVLGNLLDNAAKHARSRVRLRARQMEEGNVEIEVADDGPGLPPEAHDVVFNVGERWDTQEAGTGLGLAIARDLVTLYGGNIALRDSDLGGLSAVITLPQSRASSP